MRLIDADALMQRIEDSARHAGFHQEDYCKIRRFVTKTPTIEAIPIDSVAEMLAELFGEECCCNYNGIDEWLPMLCEHSETCPEAIGKNGCWKQFIKHWRNNA